MTPPPAHEGTPSASHGAAKRTKDTDKSDTRPSTQSDSRPPAKRARKAINCEPCRSSKLKCDRARPCSSCVLRGTVSSCYQDNDGRFDENIANRVDPHHEIAQIRQSLASLEAHILRTHSAIHPIPSGSTNRPNTEAFSSPVMKQEPDESLPDSIPNMPAGSLPGGLYTGPTSTVSHLLSIRPVGEADEEECCQVICDDPGPMQLQEPQVARRYDDDDLVPRLPPQHIEDGLVDYYFEYCNWIYRHIEQHAFSAAYARFKNGVSPDHLTLATLCVIMAIAVRYLPQRHALLTSLCRTHEDLAEEYYHIALQAFSRYQAENHPLSLDLIEFLLIRTHYLTLSKTEPEELWTIRGELVTLGTAMGLHRDPDKWRMSREIAERRRWAWWHIIQHDRWQCFLFGRPLAIASHHFDTHLPSPSHSNLSIDPEGSFYLPNIHLFRLSEIIGDVVDDAVSVRPVQYERIQSRDNALVELMNAMPKDLDMDDYRLARALSSPMPGVMRLGVQSAVIRMLYYHVRFTLHRPYVAALRSNSRMKSSSIPVDNRMVQSLDASVHAADKLIQLVAQTRQDLLANSSLAVQGHVHWGPFHCFSAAMFFSFQLIADPDQPGASLFRTNISRALDVLAHSRGVPIADKAAEVLQALMPLYDSPQDGTPEGLALRERKKKAILRLVRNLEFPYQGSSIYPSTYAESPGNGGASRYSIDSPVRASSISPPSSVLGHDHSVPSGLLQPYQPMVVQQAMPPISTRHEWTGRQSGHMHVSAQTYDSSQSLHGLVQQAPGAPPDYYTHTSLPPAQEQFRASHQNSETNVYGAQPDRAVFPSLQQQHQLRTRLQSSPAEAMWVASVGFGQGDWVRFLDAVQKSDGSQMPPPPPPLQASSALHP